MKLSLVQEFSTKFTVKLPAEPSGNDNKTDNYRDYTFVGRYKLFPQTEDAVVKLKEMQDERGIFGFLEHVMLGCELQVPKDGIEFVNENDEQMPCLDWVKRHVIAQQDAMLAFWEVVNKGVNEKNSRKSQKR